MAVKCEGGPCLTNGGQGHHGEQKFLDLHGKVNKGITYSQIFALAENVRITSEKLWP